MDIKDVKSLTKVIQTCRKHGVDTIKVTSDGTIELHLGALPEKTRRQRRKSAVEAEVEKTAEQAQLSQEDILYWSSAGAPGAEAIG